MGFLAEYEEVASIKCLRLMTRACYFIGVGLSALLTLSAAGRAIAADSSLEKRLASATVLQEFNREFNTPGTFVRGLLGARNLAALEFQKPDSTIVAVYDLNGQQCFRVAGKSLGAMQLSEDGSTLIISEAVGVEDWKYRIFDSTGMLRFEIGRSAFLLPSPSGKHFCNLYDGITEEQPTIYDKDGKEIANLKHVRYSWNCRFLNDDCLIIANRDTAWFVAAANGEVIRTVTLPLNIPYDYAYPAIRVSQTNSLVALYSDHSLVLLSFDGKVLWHNSFDEFLSAVAFDDHGSWMALHLMTPKVSGYVKVVSITDPERVATSIAIASLAGYYHRGFEVMWFSRGVITIWQPSLALVNALESDKPYFTLFMEFNTDSLSLGQPMIKPGLYWDLGDQGEQTKYLYAQPARRAAILSVETKTQEVNK